MPLPMSKGRCWNRLGQAVDCVSIGILVILHDHGSPIRSGIILDYAIPIQAFSVVLFGRCTAAKSVAAVS